MTAEERLRWDNKWGEMASDVFSPHPLLTSHKAIFSGGIAIDLACGLGQNAIWLAENGFSVLAIDTSGVALEKAMSEARAHSVADHLLFVQMDLRSWSLAENVFDLVCVFRYLERDLFPGIQRGIKPGGVLIYTTRHLGILQTQPQANRNYLLEPGELFEKFGHWDVIHYKEGSIDAQIIARKN